MGASLLAVLGLLAVAAAAAALALPSASRRLRPGRVTPQATAAPSGAEARPEAQPRDGVTGPFGYDDGVTIGDAP